MIIRDIRKKTCAMIASIAVVLGMPAFSLAASIEEESEVFRVGICIDEDSVYAGYVKEGFKDALGDVYGKDSVVFAEQTVSGSPSAATAAETLVGAHSQLIFAYGNEALEAAASVSTSIPIIFGGVSDYRSPLHLLPSDEYTTGRNVSGVSGLSSPDRELSLLIEAADNHPDAVGIIYEPTDMDAIMQNELFEKYLNEAGIPWREYEVLQPVENTTREAVGNDPIVPLPSISAAASGKEGANIHPDSIGDNGDLTGINVPSEARSAKKSALWKKKGKLKAQSYKSTLRLCAKQCDAIYLCAKNRLGERAKKMSLLKKLCEKQKCATIGGDIGIGRSTLVCLTQDPYDLGYQCGKKAIEVLNGDEEIEELPISSPDPDKTIKLYDKKLSEAIGKTWPKSFKERDGYLDTYEAGSLTERLLAD